MGDNGAGQDVERQLEGVRARAALGETWEGLAEVCFELSENEWALPTECPGWDVKDQLSHLIGIERAIMGDPVPEWDQPMGAHVKNDFAAANERFVAVRRALSGPAVRAEFVEVTTLRLAQLDALSAAGWAEVGWSPIGEVPRAQFMTVRVYDSWVHEQDVRLALDRPGGSGNLASAIALDRVQGAMPFVVGKKAGCAEGTAIRFDVAGPGADARIFTIAVEGGRARPVADDVTPTATLSLSGVDFMRLGCGRATAAQVDAAGGLALAGDALVGQSVLGAMNFMF
ncbi:MAG TPA: maleylpyruvate isomerase family mycothiol-dependent enzyme [Acidimicrobiales bacterium]|jgi:uncharacterized protein (TIGR03083 family)|nr:maleylpyruvate isomerase family mycothiol-dependent enzyme [Acidimicrobiales bacterium]